MSIHPISFSIPSLKWEKYRELRTQSKKSTYFSKLIPKITKYSHFDEGEYIQDYSKSYFAITFRKGGWESLRHYEILMAGTLPYFLQVDEIPEGALCSFPIELLKKVHKLPGMPSQEDVINNIRKTFMIKIDKEHFDKKKYFDLRKEFLIFVNQNMLSKHIVKSVLDISSSNKLSPLPEKFDTILVSSHRRFGKQDYQRDLLCVGILELGYKLHTSFDISYLFEGSKKETELYGRGFTYGKSVPDNLKKNWCKVNLFGTHEEPVVILTTKSNTPDFPIANYTGTKIFVDGNDDIKSISKRMSPDGISCIFYRENRSIYESHDSEERELILKTLENL